MFTALHWPTLEQLNHYTSPFQNAPNIVWVGIALFLGIIAGIRAKERERREQAAYSEARGWQYSDDWSPVRDQDWKQLRESEAGIEGTRKDFIWGTHRGTTFVMFQATTGRRMLDPERPLPETVIAYKKPADLPVLPSAIAGGGTPWDRYVTDHWVFLRPVEPRWILRGPSAEQFVEEAYVQLRGVWGPESAKA
jgi:hypothetical protein